MGKKVKDTSVAIDASSSARPRLVKIIIKNFRSIGAVPVSIDLDDIVVLVGPNNAGKSSVLKAYEVIMQASKEGQLTIEDFPSGVVNPKALPEIELHTVVYDNGPGPEWVQHTSSGEKLVRELWQWPGPGAATRRGYNVIEDRWANDDDKEKVPWGATAVANARRPQPHRIDAFASPSDQSDAIVKLLMQAITDRVSDYKSSSRDNKESDFGKLLTGIESLQKKIVAESGSQISAIEDDLSLTIGRVFPGYRVIFDAKAEDDIDKSLSLFKANPRLLMGPEAGYLSDIGHQGSGARRTLMWTAIRLLSESNKKSPDASQRPHVLLLDEPEICLHPNAVREACDLLYSLPELGNNWQVMVTTHSPCFIDLTRDHTTIVRVERMSNGQVSGTTIFRPQRASFSATEKEALKMLNMFDPYVAEFFFGGRTIIVEGDTEYTVFKYVAKFSSRAKQFENIHVVRARGKDTIVSLVKILNQFGSVYSVLHDSDAPTIMTKGGVQKNGEWTSNSNIREAIELAEDPSMIRHLVTLGSFEPAYLGTSYSSDKPYRALEQIRDVNSAEFKTCERLLLSLVSDENPPAGCVSWESIDSLERAFETFEQHNQAPATDLLAASKYPSSAVDQPSTK